MVAGGLDAQARQLLFGAALDEQRHEVPDRVTVELRVSVVDHRGDGIRRYVWVDAPQPVDQLFDGRPFTCADLTRNRNIANFAVRLPDSQQLSTSAYLLSQVCSTCQMSGFARNQLGAKLSHFRRAVFGVDAKGVVEC